MVISGLERLSSVVDGIDKRVRAFPEPSSHESLSNQLSLQKRFKMTSDMGKPVPIKKETSVQISSSESENTPPRKFNAKRPASPPAKDDSGSSEAEMRGSGKN